jgi:hypothetical protein
MTITNLLDERIATTKYDLGIWKTDSGALYSATPKYKGIADTIVQLIRRNTSGVIVPSQPIRSDG